MDSWQDISAVTSSRSPVKRGPFFGLGGGTILAALAEKLPADSFYRTFITLSCPSVVVSIQWLANFTSEKIVTFYQSREIDNLIKRAEVLHLANIEGKRSKSVLEKGEKFIEMLKLRQFQVIDGQVYASGERRK